MPQQLPSRLTLVIRRSFVHVRHQWPEELCRQRRLPVTNVCGLSESCYSSQVGRAATSLKSNDSVSQLRERIFSSEEKSTAPSGLYSVLSSSRFRTNAASRAQLPSGRNWT